MSEPEANRDVGEFVLMLLLVVANAAPAPVAAAAPPPLTAKGSVCAALSKALAVSVVPAVLPLAVLSASNQHLLYVSTRNASRVTVSSLKARSHWGSALASLRSMSLADKSLHWQNCFSWSSVSGSSPSSNEIVRNAGHASTSRAMSG